jgi:hypothetical protein
MYMIKSSNKVLGYKIQNDNGWMSFYLKESRRNITDTKDFYITRYNYPLDTEYTGFIITGSRDV